MPSAEDADARRPPDVERIFAALAELEIAVAGRDDLISMKRAGASPVDRDDLAVLTEPER